MSIVNQMVKYSSANLDRTFAALADPTRRRILAHLARGDKRVTHLARPYAMSLPAVSKHLRVLEKAGLLRRRRYGRVHEMQLEAKPLKQAAQWVEEYRKFWEGSLDRLADYLEKTNKEPPTRRGSEIAHVSGLRCKHGVDRRRRDLERRIDGVAVSKFLGKRNKQIKRRKNETGKRGTKTKGNQVNQRSCRKLSGWSRGKTY